MRRLEALERDHPELAARPIHPRSASAPRPARNSAPWSIASLMLSLANAMDAEEMLEFDQRIKRFLKS